MNCAKSLEKIWPKFKQFDQDFKYLNMNWDDSSNQAITLNIEVVLKFIENAIEVEKGQVFVHCAQGVSRSGAIEIQWTVENS